MEKAATILHSSDSTAKQQVVFHLSYKQEVMLAMCTHCSWLLEAHSASRHASLYTFNQANLL